jgi:transcriptional regulator with XRE-family HTH domain
MHIGRKIRIARAVKGITQEELADKIGKTRPLISQIESTGKVKASTLRQICKILDIDPEDPELVSFLEENEIYTRNTKSSEHEALKREVDMLRELVQAQKEIIEHLRKQAKRPAGKK